MNEPILTCINCGKRNKAFKCPICHDGPYCKDNGCYGIHVVECEKQKRKELRRELRESGRFIR
jgi:hypothetical protein